MLTLIEPIAQLTEGWQLWGESIESKLESLNLRTETIASNLAIVADRAQESLEHVSTSLAELHHKSQSDWSDRSLAETDEYQELKARIEALETGDPSVPDFGAEPSAGELLRNLAERVADLESEGPRGMLGAGTVSYTHLTLPTNREV